MTDRLHLQVIDRRDFIVGASAAALVTALVAGDGRRARPPRPSRAWKDAMKKAIGDAQPAEGQGGARAPGDRGKRQHGPVHDFGREPDDRRGLCEGRARIRHQEPAPRRRLLLLLAERAARPRRRRACGLGTTQDVIAVAEMSDGKFYIGKRTVKVTIGGCGG